MPATATASTRSSVADSVMCATGSLNSMGYQLITADDKSGMVQAQRLKHATNPFSGASDADRITVLLGNEEQHTSMQIIGETVGTRPSLLRFNAPRARRVGGVVDTPPREPGLVRKWTSREVAADTNALARNCGG